MKLETTTIKIAKKTKARLDTLKEYKRESYEEIVEKILEVLNTCRASPAKARDKLIQIDTAHKEKILKQGRKDVI